MPPSTDVTVLENVAVNGLCYKAVHLQMHQTPATLRWLGHCVILVGLKAYAEPQWFSKCSSCSLSHLIFTYMPSLHFKNMDLLAGHNNNGAPNMYDITPLLASALVSLKVIDTVYSPYFIAQNPFWTLRTIMHECGIVFIATVRESAVVQKQSF